MKKVETYAINVTVNGEQIPCYKISNTINGVPRYVVHFLSIGVKPADYGKISGLTRYRAKWFGGGYVFQSYNVADDLKWMIDTVKRFYKSEGLKALAAAEKMSDDELLNALQ